MDPIQNPFSPGAGSPPLELVGREPILEQARVLVARILAGRPERSMLLTGLRGVGKTVLLNEIERMARSAGCRTVSIEAHDEKPLGPLIAANLRSLLYDLSRAAGAGNKVRRSLAVLASFVGSLKLTFADVTLGVDIDPEKGTADSGDLETDLAQLFVAVAEAAEDRGSAVVLLIDEIQYFGSRELGALIMAMHRVQQRRLPLVLLGAGLPILPGLAGDSESYAERVFSFPDVGALSAEDSARALRRPAQAAGVEFPAGAAAEVYRLTRGYPYFLQEWGYQAWNLCDVGPISVADVRRATETSTARLDRNFFRVRFDRLAPSEKRFLRAMAELGAGPHRSGAVADVLGRKVTSLGPVRAKLIRKGMIYSPAHGELAFTVPLFNDFMLRTMPTLEG